MLIVTIKDMKVRLGNLCLPLGKNAIGFESSAQNGETSKQTTSAP